MKFCPTCGEPYTGREVKHAKVCPGFGHMPRPPLPDRGGSGYQLRLSRSGASEASHPLKETA